MKNLKQINIEEPARQTMMGFIKSHNASLGFRTKGKKVKCVVYFPEDNLRVTGSGEDIIDAYNAMLCAYIEYLEEQEEKEYKANLKTA